MSDLQLLVHLPESTTSSVKVTLHDADSPLGNVSIKHHAQCIIMIAHGCFAGEER